jgi:hypothetical protein
LNFERSGTESKASANWLEPFFAARASSSAMPYTAFMRYGFVLLLAVVLVPASYPAEKLYVTGKIIDVQQKTNTRVLYYQVNTPITRDEPYYEVSVQVKDMIYVGDYNPRHAGDTLPDEWNVPQTEVRLRLDKHYMFLTRPAGSELQFVITKRIAAAPAQNNPDPPSPKK